MSMKIVFRGKNIEMIRKLVKPVIFSRESSLYAYANVLSSNSCLSFQQCKSHSQFTKRITCTPKFATPVCDLSTSGFGNNDDKNKLSLFQRFKLMYKEYWYVLLPVHVATSACWLGGFYYMAISGIDISALLEVVGAPDSWVTTVRASKAGGIVTAYTLYKVATPARYTVTLGATTVTINYLKKWGMIKPMPSREKLKVMYEDKKSAFKEKMTSTTDEIKDEFVKTTREITDHMKEAKTGFSQSVGETRKGLQEGVREAADEWRHVGKLLKRNVKEIIKPEKRDESK